MGNTSDNNEINFIRDEMKGNLSIRTTLLTFSFTSVITTIGFGISKFDIAPFWIYIVPVLIIIVFSARITYYKDLQSKMNAYLHTYYSDAVKIDNAFNNIEEGYCKKNKIQSFLINYELLVLSIICSLIYYYKYFKSHTINFDIKMIFFIILPVILLVFQYNILNKVPSYHEKTKYYIGQLNNNQTARP